MWMWDEDPRVQESIYRVLLWSVVVGLVGGFIVAFWSGEWSYYLMFLEALAIFLVALCLYAALVWSIGDLVRLLWRLARRFTRRP